MNYIEELGKKAKAASRELLKIGTKTKNDVLFAIADELINKKEEIKAANKIDMENGKKNGMAFSLLDRMELTDSRIEGMAQSLREMAMFPDPIGEVITGWNHKNGMNITKKRVPLGVIGMIYESRPNVTADAAGLAIKSSNAIILRGSEDALNSNIYLNNLLNRVADAHGLPKNTVQLVEKPERELVKDLIRADKYIDVIIPRGGKGLKICHIFVDETADIKQALPIIENAKVQRPSVCNAIETTLIHENIAKAILPELTEMLLKDGVELRYSKEALEIVGNRNDVKLATEEDFGAEYLDLIMSLKLVKNIDEAIEYINNHGTHHSDSILTKSIENAEKFLNEVDSANVYLNASTRFSDGGEFGFGGEIGISTQKLHARGPMGIRELTTTKYVIRGEGQIRE